MISTRSIIEEGMPLRSTTISGFTRHRATAIDQHEAAIGTEASQRHRSNARRVDGRDLKVGVAELDVGRGGRVEGR